MGNKKNVFNNDFYLISKDYKLLEFNESVAEAYPLAKPGDYCYKVTANRDKPCTNCPVAGNSDKDSFMFFDFGHNMWKEACFSQVNDDKYAVTCRPSTDSGICVFDSKQKDRKDELMIVEALCSAFLNVYIINKENRTIERVKQNGYVSKGLERLDINVFPYDDIVNKFIMTRVYEEDKSLVSDFMNWDNLISNASDGKDYDCIYRVKTDTGFEHYQIKITSIEGADFLICGFQNIDAMIEAEEKRNKSLQQNLDIISCLSDSFLSIYYLDIANEYYWAVKKSEIEFIRNTIGEKGSARVTFDNMIQHMVGDEFKDAVREFCDLNTLPERLAVKNSISLQYEGIRKIWLEGTFIAAHRDENGNCIHALWTIRSVTEQKLKDEEHKRALAEALSRAETANAAKTTFLFNMSHDIRTPMNAIIGFRDLLEKNQEDPVKRADYLAKIEDSSHVLLSIINNVLEMARIEKGELEIDETVWSVEQFNDSIFSLFSEMMEQKKLTFTTSIDIEHKYVYCDAIKLRQILINILSNAYKYTNEGGSVTMSLKELPWDTEGYCLFETTITDTGIGMSEDFIPHMFDEFTREKVSSENKIEGTGLGMPIIKRLINILGGTLEVKSKQGVGTTMIVVIPHRIADKSQLKTHYSAEYNKENLKDKRILLAEDNDMNAEIATEVLKEAGFVVERAENGQICCDMIAKEDAGYYDVVLMDIQMPVMNGYEATIAIRSLTDESKASIPIVAMTANAFEEDKRKAINVGMNAHLSKPINVKEMMSELAYILK